MRRFCAVVVAAGRGVRFGGPKQLIDIAGRPMVAWSLATFGTMDELGDLVIATEAEALDTLRALAREYAPRLHTRVVLGGATRQESVERALNAVPSHCDAVFVHDGARPLVASCDVRAGMDAIGPGVGALLATPVVDTIKLVEAQRGAPRSEDVKHSCETMRAVVRTLERDALWAAETPQFAMVDDLRHAHALARRDGVAATDDAMLLERAGRVVLAVRSSAENFKVTREADRDRAETILRSRAARVA